MALQFFVGSWPLFLSSVSWFYTQSVGLGRGNNPSQGRYLQTEQHKHRINAHNTDIHALSGIRTHDPSVRASEESSCLRPRGRSLWSANLSAYENKTSWERHKSNPYTTKEVNQSNRESEKGLLTLRRPASYQLTYLYLDKTWWPQTLLLILSLS
jgi:hypothetical protein